MIYKKLQVGSYYIEVSSSSSAYTGGPYMLNLQSGLPPGTPISLEQTASGNLSVTGAAKGTCNSGSSADRWSFSIAGSTTITIDVTSTAFDTYVCLLNSNN